MRNGMGWARIRVEAAELMDALPAFLSLLNEDLFHGHLSDVALRSERKAPQK
jgi:hypothetical protein